MGEEFNVGAIVSEMKIDARQWMKALSDANRSLTTFEKRLKTTQTTLNQFSKAAHDSSLTTSRGMGKIVAGMKQATISTTKLRKETKKMGDASVRNMRMATGATNKFATSLRNVKFSTLINGPKQATPAFNTMTGAIGGSLKGIVALGASYLTLRMTIGVVTKVLRTSTTAAIEFESAWTGVEKTVDGTKTELKALQDEVVAMARVMPIAITELFGVAEAAGQLGIKKSDIADFTKTMVELGVTTNLTAKDAAIALARWANITGITTDRLDDLASVIVELGNTTATTEREILDMGIRLVAVGSMVGATDEGMLALSASLSSIGLNAELAGTAVNRLMIEMSKAVSQGGDKLTQFAVVAGKTGDEFTEAFGKDPIEALIDFTKGLDQFAEAGGVAFQVLDDLGLDGVRLVQTITGMGAAWENFARDQAVATEEMANADAMAIEVAKRYDDVREQLVLLDTQIKLTAKDIGDILTPALLAAKKAEVSFLGRIKEELESLRDSFSFFKTMAQIELFPSSIKIKVDAETEAADAALKELSEELEKLREKTVFSLTLEDLQDDNLKKVLGELSKLQDKPGSGITLTSEEIKSVGTSSGDDIVTEEMKKRREAIEAVFASQKKLIDQQKELNETARRKEFAESLRLSVSPAEDLKASINEILSVAKEFPNIIDQDIMSTLFGELGEGGFKSLAKGTAEEFQAVLEQLDAMGTEAQAIADIMRELRAEQDAAAFTEELGVSAGIVGDISPQLDMIDELEDRINQLRETGDLTGEVQNLLAIDFWSELQNQSEETIQAIIEAVKNISPEIAEALGISSKELKTLTFITELGFAIDALGPKFDGLGFSITKAFKDIKKSVASKDVKDSILAVGEGISDVLLNVKGLKPGFKAAALAARTASRIIRIAMAAANPVVAALKEALFAILEAVGLFGKESQKELKGMAAVIEDLKELTDSIADKLTDSILEFVDTGKFAIEDFVDFVLGELARIATLRLVVDPIVDFASDVFGDLIGKSGDISNGDFNSPELLSSKSGTLNGDQIATKALFSGARVTGSASSNQSGAVSITINNFTGEEVQVNQTETDQGTAYEFVIGAVKQGDAEGEFQSMFAKRGLTEEPI